MNHAWAFHCLQLTPDADERTIRRRYAELLKSNRPEDNPSGFQQLRAAYEICLAFARAAAASHPSASVARATVEAPAAIADESAAASSVTANQHSVAAATGAPEFAHDGAPDAGSRDDRPHTAERRPISRLPQPASFLPMETAADALAAPLAPARTPAAAVEELVNADARGDANAAATWLAQCPEIFSLVTRDAVELDLQQSIAGGTRFSPVTLELLAATFDWRQLSLQRRLLQHGLGREGAEQLVQALRRAHAEAEFKLHVESRKTLGPEGPWHYDRDEQCRQLLRLHAQREALPRLRQALWPGRVDDVNRLVRLYARHYGGSAALQIFGSAAVQFWSRMDPLNGVNWQLYRLRVTQTLLCIGLFYLILPVLQLFSLSTPWALKWIALRQWSVIWLYYVLPVTLALVSLQTLLRCIGENRQRLEPYRLRILRALSPWLAPRRALPLQLVLAPILIACGHYHGPVIPFATVLLLCGLFGMGGFSVALISGLVGGSLLYPHWPWPDSGTFIPALACGCLLLAWLIDWLGNTGVVRRQALEDEAAQLP